MIANRNIKDYSEKYDNKTHYDFEKYQVKYRRQNILQQIHKHPHKFILEVGCGIEPFFEFIDNYEKFVIVEPSLKFYNIALKKTKKNKKISLINDFVENINLDAKFDFVIISSLLHEIEEPSLILKAIRKNINRDSIIYINVPNAKSFHRLLAYESGLIQNIYQKSENQKKFQQSHTFDLDSLTKLLKNNEFEVLDSGSYFVKPFTHLQMIDLMKNEIIDENILDGFDKMVKYCKDLGSEIYCIAKLNQTAND